MSLLEICLNTILFILFLFFSYKFKAKEIDHNMMTKNGMYGMPPLRMLPVTDSKPFKFQSDARLELRKQHGTDKDEETERKSIRKVSLSLIDVRFYIY